MAEFIMIIVSAVFINNFVVMQFLGICPFLGVSKDFKSALGMGLAVTFVMTITCLITYPISYGLIFFTELIAISIILGSISKNEDNSGLIIKTFAKGEKGYWETDGNVYVSLVDVNVYTPEQYAANWEIEGVI